MPLKESLSNIIKPNGPGQVGEFTGLGEALREENRVSVAFLKGEISLEEYYQCLEKTCQVTNTNFRELAAVSDKRV
ncbi:MAG: hypothetical protein UV71_C0012G0031 [Microgenomates group bacterium GW2011_GWC1_43_13]|uniref:Uncharacterized protein n=3 Tax=Candidatus Woeseibacteriota TaxID=1752722 RepID=A0A837IDH8_9BACT|nr:MAG: hypothetical protein UV71_C0012G0031 [Microgenomates group bacterium GW2011_GWC1_43_13]KKT33110.1 MAG: hypothetical protein UW20_C0005G0042 [Candidatus Woesebacteria bacterium GW2011_GWB1_44_11]KKT54772.1 MAG: hypothetical protein UW47_C0003G0041 [Candidatus Woesebacteria bacterium GW2011_GWA1_44_23]OGM76320.1 MAG: hypothetical protein A2208_01065 [Candidatus Woesebacteria bacterium RIFOXYA1_FULL_43_16]OGM81547.1 MAG: hypothetical protein A2394_01125 [Candidatus Woesebacteria bacterium 